MKIILLMISILMNRIVHQYVVKTNDLDSFIFELYTSNFEEYLTIDENYEIKCDKVKLKEEFQKKGYLIRYQEGFLNFTIYFKNIFSFEKEYRFFLEKNNEI